MCVLLPGCGIGTDAVRLAHPEYDARLVPRGTEYHWTFDALAPPAGRGDVAPRPARAMDGVLGDWRPAADPSAPSSPNVMRQDGRAGAREAPRLFAMGLDFADVRATVRCKIESGAAGEACGLVAGASSADDYWVATADALEGAVRLVRIDGGVPREIARVPAKVDPWQWHALSLSIRGAKIQVAFDDVRLEATDDEARSAAGLVGLWTRADTVAAFDDFTATSL